MTRVWYCAKCGYEVHSRGRCHACREKLTPSAMPELASGPDDDEVGYRVVDWTDRDRGQLIVRLNDMAIEHRFEDDELVVDAADEARVDDLVALLGDTAEAGLADPGGGGAGTSAESADRWADDAELDDLDGSETGDDLADVDADEDLAAEDQADDDFAATVRLLADAATRLRVDPTDMQADADVAEASAGVFMVDRYGPFDEEGWSAVGRVTRRLLSALGADEALEEDIRKEASVLEKLLAPLGATPSALELNAGGPGAAGGREERTEYELADWQPDERAELSILLDQKGIVHEWEGDDLLVPSAREDEVEALFDQVGGGAGGEGDDDADERRYQAVAELFAACGRLAGDPTDESRQGNVLHWIERSEGPALLGLNEVDWLRIRSRARALAAAIEEPEPDPNDVFQLASQLHDLLRSVV